MRKQQLDVWIIGMHEGFELVREVVSVSGQFISQRHRKFKMTRFDAVVHVYVPFEFEISRDDLVRIAKFAVENEHEFETSPIFRNGTW